MVEVDHVIVMMPMMTHRVVRKERITVIVGLFGATTALLHLTFLVSLFGESEIDHSQYKSHW